MGIGQFVASMGVTQAVSIDEIYLPDGDTKFIDIQVECR